MLSNRPTFVFTIASLVVACGGLDPGAGAPGPAEPGGRLVTGALAGNYVGCYSDSPTRALPTQLIASGATVESCVAAAQKSKLTYAGLQYGGECWAGNTLGISKVTDGQCAMTCSANSAEVCGGSWLNSIYSTASPTTTAGSYVGCYTDSANRALPNLLLSSGATIESCASAAQRSKLAYAGLQYGGECWAGNALGISKVADSQCAMKCTGNTAEVCGGSWLNSIYSVAASIPAPTPTPAPTPVTVGAEYFVSPAGSDANPGTLDRPFATLERAQAAVQALKSSPGLPANGVAITLRAGYHYRTSTLELSAADSGTATRQVIWRAYPGETVRISGARKIASPWSAVTSADANWARIQAHVPLYKTTATLTSGFGSPDRAMAELIYNGTPMQLGRWPNGSTMSGYSGSGTSLNSATSLPARNWNAAAQLATVNKPYAHVVPTGFWDMTSSGGIQLWAITGVSGNTLKLAGAASPPNGEATWNAYNLLEEVDQPGEYWMDRETGAIYFYPPGGANPGAGGGEVLVTELSGPVVALGAGASYIRFQGITFEAGRGDIVSDAGGTTGITFSGCTFRNGSGTGLLVRGSGFVVDRCSFYQLTIGINLAGAQDATVSNSELHHVGRYGWTGMAAIDMSGSGHWIHNNYMHDTPGAAIAGGGASNIVIELNEFANTVQMLSDYGTIYVGGATNAEVRYNYFHDVARPTAPQTSARVGFYIDCDGPDHCAGYYVHGNLFYRYGTGTSSAITNFAILTKDVNTFRNNLFARCDGAYVAGYLGAGSVVTANQSWITDNADWPLPSGNVVNADPGFIDEAGGNLANRADGTIAVAGASESIPFSRIGMNR